MSDEKLRAIFPNLLNTPYVITSEKDKKYNCIAWAAGDNAKWWWPLPEDNYWPNEAQAGNTMRTFADTFGEMGYDICEHGGLEPGYEKVALYTIDKAPTHMARQLPTGDWTSKCGQLEDISHLLEGIEGDGYGSVALFMKRPNLDFS
ncbi:MAG TPA: hypothetical protein ENI77_11100 [Nitrospirae bacterium]|nr:hypothetical protein [Nitrospirota bacterium]